MRKRRVALITATYLAALAVSTYYCVSQFSASAVAHKKARDSWTSLALAAYRLPTTDPTMDSPPGLPPRGPAETRAKFVSAVNAYLWTQAVMVKEQQAAAAASAAAAAASSSTTTSGTTSQTSTTTPTQANYSTPSASASSTNSSSGGGLTFGLFPCIIQAESGGNASDHSGLYGDLDSTWAGYDGYPYAGAAPVWVQNQFNLNLYNQDGYQPWNDSCTGR